MNNCIRTLAIVSAMVLSAAALAYAQTDAKTANIRSEVNRINKNWPKFKKVTRNIDGISTEGVEADYFSAGSDLKKITARIFGETFRATAELYYSRGDLIFAFQKLEGYDTQIGMDPPPKVVRIVESRVYFNGPNAIRVIEGKKNIAKTDSEFSAAEQAVTDLSAKLTAAVPPQ